MTARRICLRWNRDHQNYRRTMCALKLSEVSSIFSTIQMFSRACLLALALALMAGSPARAALIAYEGFDYPDGSDLTASTANGGTGWITPWGVNSAGVTIAGNNPGDTNYAGSMTYVDSAGNALVTTGGRSFYTG